MNNNKRSIIACAAFALIALMFFASQAHAQRTKTSSRAGEQVKAEKGLKDNRYFFYFINPSVTNFGTNEDKKMFREAILRDMISQMLYMKFLFHESYEEIRKSQKLLIDIYRNSLQRDIENARILLNGIVPSVFESNDKDSLLYLRLGYRDLNVSNIYLGMGDNITENLYSMRLYKYVEAMKTAKHGSRYAILGLIAVAESKKGKIPPTGAMYPFSVVIKALRDALYEYERPNLSFNTITDKIYEHVSQSQREKYLTIHFDSYFKTSSQKTLYDEIWEKAEVDTIEDYKYYKNTLD